MNCCNGNCRQGRDCPQSLAASQGVALWLLSPVLSVLRFLRMLPHRIDIEWHRWALAHMTRNWPTHPDLPHVVRQIAHLEERCNAR